MLPAIVSSSHSRAGGWLCAGLAGLWFATASASGITEGSLGIERAMMLAAERAPMLAADAARSAAAASDAQRAGALPDPTFILGIDNLTATGRMAGQLGADEMTMRRVGISQDWPSHAKRAARTAQANARYSETLVTRAATRLLVERAAGGAWVEQWSAERQVDLLDRLHLELQRGVKIAEARLRGGAGSVSEVLAANSARADHENEMALAMANLQASRATLARWLGDTDAYALTPAPPVDQLPVSTVELRASLEHQSSARLWDARSRTAETAIALARAEKRPDLSFALSYGARSGGLTDMVSFEVGIGLPVFARRRQDLDVAARRAEFDAVDAEREDARRAQSEALERELALWQGQAEAITRYRMTLLPLARDRVRVALAAYSGGADIEPWLQARRDDLETNLRYSKALADQAKRWVLFATLLPEENP